MRQIAWSGALGVFLTVPLVFGDPWTMRNDTGRSHVALYQKMESADVIVCGTVEKALSLKKGVFSSQERTIEGSWAEVNYRVDSVVKGNIATGQVIRIRFFMSRQISGSFFYPIPDEKRSLVFLRKANEDDRVFVMEPSSEPLLILPKAVADIAGLDGVDMRLLEVMMSVLREGNAPTVAGALDILLSLTNPELRSAFLAALPAKLGPGVRGVVLGYQLALGDVAVCEDIEVLLRDSSVSREELDTIAQALMEQKDPRLKPFLAKWITHSDAAVSLSAYRTISAFEDESLVPILIAALDHADGLVRGRALISLSKIIGPRKRNGEVVPLTREKDADVINLWKTWWKEGGKTRYGNAE